MTSDSKSRKQPLGGSASSDMHGQELQEVISTTTGRKPLSEQERAQIRFLFRTLLIIVALVIASATITGIAVTFIL